MIRRLFLFLLLIAASNFAFSKHLKHTTDTKQNTVTATSWLVADETGKIIRSQNIEEVRSIASISKLMTVMVVMDAKQDLDEQIGKHTRRDHIQLALVKSDNASAALLCDKYPGGKDACVQAMNFKAHTLFMPNTHFVEATGLSVFNVSTANELVNLVQEAAKYPIIVEAGHTSTAKIRVKKKWFVFHNTNPLIGYKQNVVVSKTGYIRASGGCLVMMTESEVGRRILVLLGSKNTRTRIPEAEIILRQAKED
jgi:D-alanyl-D-alanine endopeptidase (penicillin-binding protein 7)